MSKDGRYDAGAWMRRSGVSAPRDAFIELQEQILGYVQDGWYDAGAWTRWPLRVCAGAESLHHEVVI